MTRDMIWAWYVYIFFWIKKLKKLKKLKKQLKKIKMITKWHVAITVHSPLTILIVLAKMTKLNNIDEY